MTLAQGTQIDRYVVDALVGSGSMGDVYRAHDLDLQRTVALKILSKKHKSNVQLQARFVRETRALASVVHTNVVQVFATGRYEGRPYMAMEYLVGEDLEAVVVRGGPMDPVSACMAGRDAAIGLHAASQAGVIHRDVKPANLIMLGTGAVKVTDFGLAKPSDFKGPALTQQGMVVGTPDYIAPEQARGESVDARADIYALGGSLYYMLTGRPPFRTGDPKQDRFAYVMARHLTEPVPNPQDATPSVPDDVADLTMRMMAKSPDERPTYTAVIRRLSTLAGIAPPPRLQSTPPVSLSAPIRTVAEPTPTPRPAPAPVRPVSAAHRARPEPTPPPRSTVDSAATAAAAPRAVRSSRKVDNVEAHAQRPAPAPEDWAPTARSGVPRWLLALITLACIGVFVAGLAVTLSR